MTRFHHPLALSALMLGVAFAQARFTDPTEPTVTYQALGKLPDAWVLRTQPIKPTTGETLMRTFRLADLDPQSIRVQCVTYTFSESNASELNRLAYSVTVREGTSVFNRARPRLAHPEEAHAFLKTLRSLCNVKDPLGVSSKVTLSKGRLPLHEAPAYAVRVEAFGDTLRVEALER